MEENPIGESDPGGTKDSNALFEEMLRKQLGEVEYNAVNKASKVDDEKPEDVELDVRLKSAKWEFRVHGLNELKAKFEGCEIGKMPDELEIYSEASITWLSDRNASGQKAAIEAVGAFLEYCKPSTASTIWSGLMETLFEKCINQPRLVVGCVALMANALAAVETKKFQEPLGGLLDKFIDKKGNAAVRGPVAKQMSGLLISMEKLIRLFGAMKFDLSSLLPRVAKYTACTDNPTKQAAYGVLLEAFVWLRNADFVTSYVGDKQKSELERRCSEVTEEVPQPTKRFRSDQTDQMEDGGSAKDGSSKPKVPPKEIDFYDMLTETNILKDLNADVWEKSISEAVKWQQKQAAFDEITQACEKAKRLKPGDYSVFVATAVKAVQTEGNLVVITAALKSCSAMANGLRKNFSTYARSACSAAVSKLGDRQKPVIAAATALTDALLYCSSFEAYIEDIGKTLSEKNVVAKENVLVWCLKALNHGSQKDVAPKFIPKLLPLALDAVDDPTKPIRYGAGAILHHLLTKGPKPDVVRRAIDALPTKKKATADEILSKLQSPPPPVSSTEVPQPSASAAQNEKTASKPAVKAASAQQPGTRSKAEKPSAGPKPVLEEPLTEVVMDPDAAAEAVSAAVGESGKSIIEKLKEEGWSLRKEAVDVLAKYLEENPSVAASNADAFAVYLKHAGANNFKESNFNINKSVIEAARKLGVAAGKNFSKACAVVFLKGYAEKLADPKIGSSYKGLVQEYASLFSPKFVLAVILSVVPSLTNPKVHSETCGLIEQLVTDFGPQDTDITSILAFARTTLESKTPACRTVAIKMIVALYRYLGSAVLRLLGSDVKPALLTDIQTACTKAAGDGSKPPHPTKRCRLSAIQAKSKDGLDHNELTLPGPDELAAQLLDQQVPRNNIKDLITSQILKDLTDAKWNIRKDAAVKINDIITNEGKTHILLQGLGDLFSVLRSRIAQDQNRPTVKELLTVVAVLGEALGHQGSKQSVKMLLPAVFSKFSDKTPFIREACIHASTAWLKAAGLGSWLSSLVASQALAGTGEEKEALTGLLTQLDEHMVKEMNDTEGKQALEVLISPLFDLALDKSKIVRSNAEATLVKFAVAVPAAVFNREYKTVKSANQISLRSLFNQCVYVASAQSSTEGEEAGDAKGKACAAGRPTTAGGGSSNPEGFTVKLSALNNPVTVKRLEVCKKAKWPLVLFAEDIESLSTAWRPFVNDPLLSSMFEKSHVNRVVKSFEFWNSFVSYPENFASLTLSPEVTLLEILHKWSVARIIDSNAKLVAAAADFMETLMSLCLPDSPSYEVSSSALLSYVLPQLLERTGVIGAGQAQVRERLGECVRKVVAYCPPQSTFIVLMRGTASQSSRAIIVALEELSVLISKVGPDACQNLQRDVAKLGSLAGAANEATVRNTAIKGLASLYPFLGEELLNLIEPQRDVHDRVIGYLEEHPQLTQLAVAEIEEEADTGQKQNPKDDDAYPISQPDKSDAERRRSDQVDQDPERKNQASSSDDENELIRVNDLGLKDFETSFEKLLDKLGFEKTLRNTQEQLEVYDQEISAQEIALYYQDLDEECRRLCEGKTRPNECDMAYLNGKLRLEEAAKGTGRSLRFMEEIRKLYRADASSIAEGSHRLNILLDKQAEELQANDGAGSDWQAVLAPELICGVTAALGVCFDVVRLQKGEAERDSLAQAGQKLTELINRLVKNKKTLFRVSPVQLSNLLKMLLLAMSCHGTWSGCPDETAMVKRLNSVVASHFMAVVTPRSACTLVGMVIDFLLDDRESLGLEAALTIRVHRKLIKKLNSKHLVNLTDQEKQYYLRILDTAVLCLMRVDSHPLFSRVECLVDVPDGMSQETFEEDFRNLPKLKAQMEILIKELIFIAIVVLGVPLAGLYFRDVGYFMLSPGFNNQSDNPRCYRINYFFRRRLECLMNTEYSPRVTITVCPNLSELEELSVEYNTYSAWHQWFTLHPTKLNTPPLRFPSFSIDEIVSCAPESLTLTDVDKTLGTGWVNRRETRAGADVKTASHLIQLWRVRLTKLERHLGVTGDVSAAAHNAQHNMDRGLVPYELIGHYIRKTISLCSDVAVS